MGCAELLESRKITDLYRWKIIGQHTLKTHALQGIRNYDCYLFTPMHEFDYIDSFSIAETIGIKIR